MGMIWIGESGAIVKNRQDALAVLQFRREASLIE